MQYTRNLSFEKRDEYPPPAQSGFPEGVGNDFVFPLLQFQQLRAYNMRNLKQDAWTREVQMIDCMIDCLFVRCKGPPQWSESFMYWTGWLGLDWSESPG